jgi:putative sigma-54 modulation protein
MRIQVIFRKLHCNEAITDYIRRRVHFALGRFVTAIRSVHVYVMDENGPRGGEDKRCRVLITRHGGEQMIADRRGAGLHEVIDQSLQSASHSVGRSLDRKPSRQDMGRNLWPVVPNN